MGDQKDECFVIMPISAPEDYDNEHFQHVYKDIIYPACDQAGYKAVCASDVLETSFIHLDVLQKILDTPMAICDLSTQNPNVLFELGLRQAFDKPVVLIQEKGTPKIFDIAPLRYTEYRKERVYHEVLEDQQSIAAAIKATGQATEKGDGINSMVNLLSLTRPAALKEFGHEDQSPMLQMVMAEIGVMREEFRHAIRGLDRRMDRTPDTTRDLDRELAEVRHQFKVAQRLILSPQPSPAHLRKGWGLCKHGMSTLRELDVRFPPARDSLQIIRDFYAEFRSLRNSAEALLHEEAQKKTDEDSGS